MPYEVRGVTEGSSGQQSGVKILFVALMLPLPACDAPSTDAEPAEAAATGFLEAYSAQDGARACELIAPETRLQVEKQEQKPCEQAVLAVDLPDIGDVQRTQVFSGEGVVVTSEQTVFVSEFDLGWRVTAAGCTSRGEKPHDCEVQGS